MVNKIVTAGVKFAAKKIGNKALEKISDTYDNIHRKIYQNTFGPKPLNVGEREYINCLRKVGNKSQCRKASQKAIREYHRTGKY